MQYYSLYTYKYMGLFSYMISYLYCGFGMTWITVWHEHRTSRNGSIHLFLSDILSMHLINNMYVTWTYNNYLKRVLPRIEYDFLKMRNVIYNSCHTIAYNNLYFNFGILKTESKWYCIITMISLGYLNSSRGIYTIIWFILMSNALQFISEALKINIRRSRCIFLKLWTVIMFTFM